MEPEAGTPKNSMSGAVSARKKNEGELKFITITDPKQRKLEQLRRVVRSHVTAHQHAQKRRGPTQRILPYLESCEIQLPPSFPPFVVSNVFPDAWQRDIALSKGSISNILYPAVFSERAALLAIVLFGSAHYTKFCNAQHDALNYLELKGMALRAINVALEKGEPTDAIITAAMNIASVEAMFGSADAFHQHMLGMVGMVKLRGGLDMLGINGVLERSLLWIDSHGSHMTGMKPHFDSVDFSQDNQNAESRHPPPSTKWFLTARPP